MGQAEEMSDFLTEHPTHIGVRAGAGRTAVVSVEAGMSVSDMAPPPAIPSSKSCFLYRREAPPAGGAIVSVEDAHFCVGSLPRQRYISPRVPIVKSSFRLGMVGGEVVHLYSAVGLVP